MSLVFNEEQRQLQDAAKAFFNENAPIDALRKLRDEKDATGYDTQLWAQMSELGWAMITIPEAYDGLDFGYLGLGAIAIESGHTLTASPLFGTVVLGASAIEIAGSEQQKQELLPQVACGELTLALALEETNHHNPAGVSLTAAKGADGYVLNGRKKLVLDGHSADKLVVVARTSGNAGEAGGLSLFLVDADSAGISRQRTTLIDSRNAANIDFENVVVSAAALLGEADNAWPILDQILDRGRIYLAAEMLGGADECLSRTVEYLGDREQFGVKLGSFQALKHRCAEMYCELELARSVVMDALSAIDDQRADSAAMASLAKARLNDVFKLVTNEATQMHGGIGVTDELVIGFFLKRARVAMQIFGDAGFHRDRYATLCGY
ncbi:alkylation response protein AidB-like acyl-CoA dehydrogenase [Sinobacterium caligoides]|uniref:Alkylation response protein AidB-like acyl-CoA dehydrogenase n=1 Tax=Sinobacterium caligoides TaxID=933926 RepID=A0A3N2E0R1_9GAMM|nr:acyl-CoA dehydrogenase family protein [Sinobacterium caligoides]ROS05155.1 alkylation response protein AidB-like acyl-CoA dehydrogenase [Sinobacterium caligoides]